MDSNSSRKQSEGVSNHQQHHQRQEDGEAGAAGVSDSPPPASEPPPSRRSSSPGADPSKGDGGVGGGSGGGVGGVGKGFEGSPAAEQHAQRHHRAEEASRHSPETSARDGLQAPSNQQHQHQHQQHQQHQYRHEAAVPPASVEKDAAHFKMVAARFRALMERRERRLEEAMSDPQTRTDLEAMFPGVLDGDYQTLLAGVRGMEEDDFQNLLNTARKRRREQQDEAGAENGHEGSRKAPKISRARSSSPP
ncbi:unnamed protein product, partial [Scytosiphon promiscuus]